MTEKRNLTKRYIEDLPAPAEGRVQVRDEKTSGLGVVVHATGRKAFYWYKCVHGEPTWRNIGDFPATTLEEARTQAKAWDNDAAAWKRGGYVGPSPFAKREPAKVLTLDKVMEEYITKHLRAHAKNPVKAEESLRWMVGKYMAAWKPRALAEITRDDVRAWHLRAGEKHGTRTANHVVKNLRTLYRFAIRAGLWDGNPPTFGITFYHENKRDRYLQPDELPKLWRALLAAPNPDLADFVNIALWTGARKGDIFSMRWQDLDLEGGNVWTVPNPKSRVPYRIPLDVEVVKILRARLKNRTAGEPWVFPSFGETGHLMDLKARWREVLVAAGLDYPNEPGRRPTIHDLRRTQGSIQAGLGASLLVIGKSLGHASPQATQIYSRINVDAVRESMTAANKFMRKAMRKKPKAARPKLLLLKPAPKQKAG
jgi:integrase